MIKINKGIVAVALFAGLGLAACNSGNMRRNPGKAYAMDMTYSRAYDYYNMYDPTGDSQNVAARPPVSGTIARDHALPDHLIEGDSNAYKSMAAPMKFNDNQIKEGGRLFNIYCAICHGPNLDGQGPLFTSGKFASMPANFKDPKYLHIPVGQIYGAIKFGKNMMGSYASQLDFKQRWQVIAYIKQTQGSNGGDAFTMGTNPAPAAAAPAAAPAGGTDTAAAKTTK